MPTKKVAKKAAKKATKKGTKKTKKDLVHASSSQCFWVTDGRVLSNLVELRDALDAMSEDVFAYHVNKDRNDFADWVASVLDDDELAKKMRKSKEPKTAQKVIVSRLRVYSI